MAKTFFKSSHFFLSVESLNPSLDALLNEDDFAEIMAATFEPPPVEMKSGWPMPAPLGLELFPGSSMPTVEPQRKAAASNQNCK